MVTDKLQFILRVAAKHRPGGQEHDQSRHAGSRGGGVAAYEGQHPAGHEKATRHAGELKSVGWRNGPVETVGQDYFKVHSTNRGITMDTTFNYRGDVHQAQLKKGQDVVKLDPRQVQDLWKGGAPTRGDADGWFETPAMAGYRHEDVVAGSPLPGARPAHIVRRKHRPGGQEHDQSRHAGSRGRGTAGAATGQITSDLTDLMLDLDSLRRQKEVSPVLFLLRWAVKHRPGG